MHKLKLTTLCLILVITFAASATTVQIGSSYEAVVKALGKPDGELSAGSKQILTYGKGQIILKHNKVSSMSSNLEALLAERANEQAALTQNRDAGLINYRGQWITPKQHDQAMKAETQKRLTQQKNRNTAGTWFTNFDRASAIAKKEKKLLLLNFTGSDWCGWCIRLDKEVFSQKEFNDYAHKNYVLVKLDFPRKKSLTQSEITQNQTLAKKYGVRGYPTIVVLNSSGKIQKKGGYVSGGPRAFLASLR